MEIEKDQTSTAAIISWGRTDGNGVIELLVDDNVVTASERKISEVTGQVILREKDRSV